jgi:hypothetical protein
MGFPEDPIYCAGSDDFRAYAWTIPPRDELKSARRYYDRARWPSEIHENRIGMYAMNMHGGFGWLSLFPLCAHLRP